MSDETKPWHTPLECKVGLVLEISIICHIDRVKEKIKEIVSVDAEKSFEKIQHSLKPLSTR